MANEDNGSCETLEVEGEILVITLIISNFIIIQQVQLACLMLALH